MFPTKGKNAKEETQLINSTHRIVFIKQETTKR